MPEINIYLKTKHQVSHALLKFDITIFVCPSDLVYKKYSVDLTLSRSS